MRTLAARFIMAVAVFALAAPVALAQQYPTRPVRIVIGFPAGGPVDILVRIVAERMQASMGQPFIVENRPGATGSIGAEFVAKSAPDGYTLLAAPSSSHAVSPNLAKLPWDPQKDFTPIAMIGNVTTLLVVNPQLPVTSVKELVDYARANPGRLNYGTPGTGSNLHLGGEMLKQMAQVDIVHIPYKGIAPAQADMLSGQIQVMLDNIVSAMPNVKSGKVRPIAVTTAKRSELFPDLPTVAEQGYPGYAVNAWAVLLGPAGLPADIVNRLNAETIRIVNSPEVKQRFAQLGTEPMSMTPAETGEFMRSERERWAKVIRDGNIKID
jgi:tripartite-type tricarboxylate transporter receptor subunit TctC